MHDAISMIVLAALAFAGLIFQSETSRARSCPLCAGVGSLPLRGGGSDTCRFCHGAGKRK